MTTLKLRAVALDAAAFAEFGDVIEAGDSFETINRGTTRKCADLAKIDLNAAGGRPQISLYRATPYDLPMRIAMLERHPLSSQLFMPLGGLPFLIVVARPGRDPGPEEIRVFASDGRQGVNFHAGTWHHPVIAIGAETDFLVLERAGPGRNCDEFFFAKGTEPLVSQTNS